MPTTTASGSPLSAKKNPLKRLAIIGNGGGGKTTLARSLAALLGLPLFHVDSVQYLPGLAVRDSRETSEILDRLAERESWLIDGFGSFEVMERRFRAADRVLFVDFPLWRHYWWCLKRQVKSAWSPRAELPSGCNEASLRHTVILFKVVWRVHWQIRPKLLELFQHRDLSAKVVHITNLSEWNRAVEFL